MSAKPILFVDFDGTLCFDRYWRSLPPDQFKTAQELVFGDDKALVDGWMRGKNTAEEVNRLIAEKINMPFEELWGLFVRDCETMHISEKVLERLDALRDRYIVILITGNMDSFTRFTIPALKLDRYFDHINNSFFDGRFKTDRKGEIFTEYAEGIGVSLNDCVLIDDSAKTCEAFNALGGTAYLITPEQDIMHYLEILK